MSKIIVKILAVLSAIPAILVLWPWLAIMIGAKVGDVPDSEITNLPIQLIALTIEIAYLIALYYAFTSGFMPSRVQELFTLP